MENRRHHLIILGTFQRKIITTAVLSAILLINVVLITWFLIDPVLISRIDTSDILVIALVEVAIIATISILSLLASNKIAGPMYAFDKVLKEIRGGDLSARLHLRPGDICHRVASEMNETFDDLDSRITVLKDNLIRLQQLECHDTAQQALIEEMKSQLDHFTNQHTTDK